VHAFVLKDWITCQKAGRISRYEITATGRSALRDMIGKDDATVGFAEAPSSFSFSPICPAEVPVHTDESARRIRYNLAESPIAILGRRRDKDGKLFLEPDLVAAAEQLREDFELAQMATLSSGEWISVARIDDRTMAEPNFTPVKGNKAARERVSNALRDLGPGLSDVVLRVCCHLEGIETAERQMGWAARSGKIVLRIALDRLKTHYATQFGRSGPMIG
jgi:hypothetical protein